MIERIIAWLADFFGWDTDVPPTTQNAPSSPVILEDEQTPMTNQEKLYETAKGCLNEHLTLDPSVPAEKGCAEAVSAVLAKAGFAGLPAQGIAGTAALYGFMAGSPRFQLTQFPKQGDIIISPTGYGNGRIEGHTGIVAQYGILSNDSASGLWKETWAMDSWNSYYGASGGLPVLYYTWVG